MEKILRQTLKKYLKNIFYEIVEEEIIKAEFDFEEISRLTSEEFNNDIDEIISEIQKEFHHDDLCSKCKGKVYQVRIETQSHPYGDGYAEEDYGVFECENCGEL